MPPTLRWLVTFAAVAPLSCSESPTTPKYEPLPLVASYALSINEPSGLTIHPSGEVLWAVTNNPDRVHQLSATGILLRTFSYEGDDLEGIAYDAADSTLWIAEEARRELVQLSLEGEVLTRNQLALSGASNSGLEGACVDGDGRMFVLNEKSPGLFLEMALDRTAFSSISLSFADDYSGIAFDSVENAFWVVSDKSRLLALWTPAEGVLSFFGLPFDKAEGVAVNEADGLIYVVGETDNRLYVYRHR